MDQTLSLDEYNALDQISHMPKHGRPNACIARNTKRLAGIKLIKFRKDGGLELTDAGRQILFTKQCIDGLHNLSREPNTSLSTAVANFLEKKGHIATDINTGKITLTERGQECLADIKANQK